MDQVRVERIAFSVASLGDEDDEREFWLARTPGERLAAVEVMRQIVYGYDPSATRLQRVLEIVEGTPS
ncbi:MAG: hypothetical protein HY321_08705 [Armatimonadetes bacterium]|nr:hypothetical protein [Armatimonadota bacterium]